MIEWHSHNFNRSVCQERGPPVPTAQSQQDWDHCQRIHHGHSLDHVSRDRQGHEAASTMVPSRSNCLHSLRISAR